MFLYSVIITCLICKCVSNVHFLMVEVKWMWGPCSPNYASIDRHLFIHCWFFCFLTSNSQTRIFGEINSFCFGPWKTSLEKFFLIIVRSDLPKRGGGTTKKQKQQNTFYFLMPAATFWIQLSSLGIVRHNGQCGRRRELINVCLYCISCAAKT